MGEAETVLATRKSAREKQSEEMGRREEERVYYKTKARASGASNEPMLRKSVTTN